MPTEQDCVDHLLLISRGSRVKRQAVEESIALGLLVSMKWDVARQGLPSRSAPSATALAAISFTERQLADFRTAAAAILDDQRDRWALRRNIFFGIVSGVAATMIWSVLIVVMGAIAVKSHGGDFGDLLRPFVSEAPGGVHF